MYLQGNLQVVFDALYNMGIIEPVLNMDWQEALKEIQHNPSPLLAAMQVVNGHQGDPASLSDKLKSLDEQTLNYLAMEVAREYADFHSRESIH